MCLILGWFPCLLRAYVRIHTAVLPHKPKTMKEALELAHTHEMRIVLERGGPPKLALVRSPPLLPTPNLNPSVSHTPNRLPFKRLTTAENQKCREKGLCYHCDKKYSVGHKCKASPQFLLLENHDNECP